MYFDYSNRNASIGFKALALSAGAMPKIMPMKVVKPNDNRIAQNGTATSPNDGTKRLANSAHA